MAQVIINWNCRGFHRNIDEVKMFLQDYTPAALCLQETFLEASRVVDFRKYISYNYFSRSTDERPAGGSSILVKRSIVHREIRLQSTLQAVAVSLTILKTFTLCSVYIPPSHNLTLGELNNLIEQLPPPYIVVGDYNAHNFLWGCSDVNNKGKVVEDFISENNLCIWNDGSSTYIHPAFGSHSFIGSSLTFCRLHLGSS